MFTTDRPSIQELTSSVKETLTSTPDLSDTEIARKHGVLPIFVMFERKWLGLPPLPVRVMPKKRVVEPITTPEMLEAEQAEPITTPEILEAEPKSGVGRKRATDGREHDVATLYSSGVPITKIANLFGSRNSIIKDVLTSQGLL